MSEYLKMARALHAELLMKQPWGWMGPCNCMGPQPGERLCPCALRDVRHIERALKPKAKLPGMWEAVRLEMEGA